MIKTQTDGMKAKRSIAVVNSEPLVFTEEDAVDTMYRVGKGKVFVYAAERSAEGSLGSRCYVATFGEGEFFFPLVGTDDTVFIASGALNTEVVAYSKSELLQRRGKSGSTTGLNPIIAEFLHAASANLRRGSAESRDVRAIGRSGKYPAGSCLTSAELIWVKAGESVLAFNGRPTDDWVGSSWFPVSPRHTIYLEFEGSITVARTDKMIADGLLAASLDAYLRGLSIQLCEEKRVRERADDLAIAERHLRSGETLSDSLGRLGAILEGPSPSADFLSGGRPAASLFGAVACAAEAQGIRIVPIPGKEYDAGTNGLHEICRDNCIRVRPILLRGQWWKEDCGPLVCFMEGAEGESPVPVALIPRRGRGYSIPDCGDGLCIPVNEAVAERIAPQSFMLYKPFPNKRLTLADIVRLALGAIAADSRRYIVLGIVGSLIGLLIPEMTRYFLDSVIPSSARGQLAQLTLLVSCTTVTMAMFDVIKGIAMTRMETRADFILQAAVMDRVLKLPVPFFRDYTSGDLSDRSMAIMRIRSILSRQILSGMMSFIFSLVFLFQLFRYSPALSSRGLLYCLVLVAVLAVITLLQYRYEKNVAEIQGSLSGTLFQFIKGASKICVTGAENDAFGVWADRFIEKKKYAFKSGFVNNIYATISSVFPIVVSILFYITYMGFANTADGGLSTGTFIAFLSSYASFQAALISMASAVSSSVNIIPLYKRAKPILESVPEVVETKPVVTGLRGDIEVSNISFRYSPDGPYILKGVSMKIERGEFIAIVGGSGSGKSTLLRLLLGFEKAESGAIYYDSKDMDTLDVTSLRRHMGVVLQNGSLMEGSVLSNIVGSSSLTIDDAWDAARKVGFDEDIRGMPMGMHTVISAGGGTLSGGQRQRLIIARAIIHKPSILFFDEATSALDNKTQAIVGESLESLNVTRVVIAHRLSTIIKADRIFVLQGGVIEETGTYAELMEREGFFYELANRQQA